MDSAILNLGSLRRAPEMQRHLANHFVANEPSPRRTQGSSHGFHSNPLRRIVKGQRRVGEKARAHPRTKSGLRMPDLLPAGTWLARRLAVKLQLLPATDELHLSSRLVKQSCQIHRRRSATDHNHVAASK